MQEDIEKLISHYEFELLKEQNETNKNDLRIKMIEHFIEELKTILEKETNKNSSKKTKKVKMVQECVKSSIEPELIPRRKKKNDIVY